MLTVCRICLSDDQNLIQDFCDCKGSVGNAHSQCLLDWIRVLCEQKHDHLGINCEICCSPFTSKIVLSRCLDLRMLINRPVLSYITYLMIGILLVAKLIVIVYSYFEASTKGFWLTLLGALICLNFSLIRLLLILIARAWRASMRVQVYIKS